MTVAQAHPIAHKIFHPVRVAWKPIKWGCDKTGITKLAILGKDVAKATSHHLEPYQALVGTTASVGGWGLNAAAVGARR
jgi:hypothetical protein